MKVETLEELKAAFCDWRSKKRHLREPVPSDLRERAHRAIDVYGVGVVAMATKLDQIRLKVERTGDPRQIVFGSAGQIVVATKTLGQVRDRFDAVGSRRGDRRLARTTRAARCEMNRRRLPTEPVTSLVTVRLLSSMSEATHA